MTYLERASTWAGIELDDRMRSLLRRYEKWLGEEAVPSGAIGPKEMRDLERRHIADSLVFAGVWSGFPDRLADIGSGAGLPGIPLAITHPEVGVSLIDRSGRRCRLLRRVVRVLNLENVEVLQADAAELQEAWPVVTARAVASPAELARVASGLVESGGMLVVGGSHGGYVSAPGFRKVGVPAKILDQSVSILIMEKP